MNAMYSFKSFIVLIAVLTALIETIFSMPRSELSSLDDDDQEYPSFDHFHRVPQDKVRGSFLVEEAHFRKTCNKYPRVCAATGSPGPDCCKKKCVDVMNDRFNCGKCGKRCKYSEVCCQGWCVNPYWDERHCGKCNHSCKKGSSCRYGLCNYA